jgi:hypothetical protein
VTVETLHEVERCSQDVRILTDCEHLGDRDPGWTESKLETRLADDVMRGRRQWWTRRAP